MSRPKIVALLSWYDEEAEWLAATIASLARCHIDHLVAVDGAYHLYPGGRPRSDAQQAALIVELCYGLGIGLTLHQPDIVWTGNEVEKRSYMFKLAETLTTENDWYWVIDADEVATHPIDDLHHQLANTPHDVAETILYERQPANTPATHTMPLETGTSFRCFFRALRGLHVTGNHWTYKTPDGRVLWGDHTTHHQPEPAAEIACLRIQHRTQQRRTERARNQFDYYRRRRELAIETGKCDRCDQPATKIVASGFDINQHNLLEAGHTNVCDHHADEVHAENDKRIRALGHDPATIQAHMYQPA